MNPLQQAREKYEVRTEKALAAAFNKLAPVTAENIGVIVPAAAEVRAARDEYETTLREILAREVKEQMPPEKAKGSDATAEAMLKGMRHQSEIAQDIIRSKYL